MQHKVTVEIHVQCEEEIAHPELLLVRLANLIQGNIVRMPGGEFDFQEVEVWATTFLTGLEAL